MSNMSVNSELSTVSSSVTFEAEIKRLQTIVDFVSRHNIELLREVEYLKKSLTEVKSVKNCLELAFQSDEIRVLENAPWFESCLKIVQDAHTMLNHTQFYSISCSPERVSSFKGNIINIISSEPIDVIGFTHNVTLFMSLAASSKVPDTKKLIKKCKEVGNITIKILKAWNAVKNANDYIKRLINSVNYIESVVAMEENGSLNVNGNVDVELSDNTVEIIDYGGTKIDYIIDLMTSTLSLTGRRPFKRELPSEFENQVEKRTKRLKLEGGVIVTPATIKMKRSCPYDTVSRAPKRGYLKLASSKTIGPRKKLIPNLIVS
ncbi:Hypothetical protein CINCED_3A019477 [Cinara cedri]|uniref:Uncharacterized protein n=1 Tax=Cinara cedri TaxID=506608 RepID=A0A5E4MNX6_9HEMI|nr:Hypothetical protein CINCED_3A019477 [Cinara cedri]